MAMKKAKPKSSTPKPPRGANQTGAGYIRKFKGNVSDNAGKVGAIKGSVKYGDASGFVGGEPVSGRGRTLQRAIDQAKRNPKKKNVKRGAK